MRTSKRTNKATLARVGIAMMAFAIVGSAALRVHAVSGTWNGISGNWSAPATWSGGTVADGTDSTANFTGVNIIADQTITLDTARTIGNITYTDATTASHNMNISGANILTLDVTAGTPTINVTQSGRAAIINSVIAGNDGLLKTGAGELGLNGINTFSGGINLAAGTIRMETATNDTALLGAAGNTLTYTGNATLRTIADGAYDLPQNITINGGVTGTVAGAFGESVNVTGVLDGSGTLVVQGLSAGFAVSFNNTANTFTGAIRVLSGDSSTLRMRSLVDSANTIGLQSNGDQGGAFEYASGAIAPLVLNSRQFELITNGAAGANISRQPTLRNNAALANTVTVNTNLLITGTGAKRFVLGGSNTGNNTFAGVIADAIGVDVLHLHKVDAGKWRLSNANTFQGITTVAGGTLALANVNAIQNSTLDTGTSGTQLVTFEVAGTNTYNLGGLQGADPLAIGANTISVGANGASTSYSGNISGTGGLTKVGPGTLTLAAANVYSGATNILNGTLLLGAAGSISSSMSVSIGAGAVLDTNVSSFNMLGGQPFTWSIDPTGAGLAGLLDASILNIASGNATFNALGILDDAFYIVANYNANSLTGTFASAVLPVGYVIDYNFNNLNQIALVQNANATVPEPTTLTLAALGLTGLMMRRRRNDIA